jgi:two-component system NtrC family sensor kinase
VRLRVASIAFLLAAISTGVAWLSLQPVLIRLVETVRKSAEPSSQALSTKVGALLPLLLGLDLCVAAIVIFGVLQWTVARPLREAELEVDQLGRLGLNLPIPAGGGRLTSPLRGALRRMAEALKGEQEVTRQQLVDLRESNSRLAQTQAGLVASERLATVGKLAAGVAHEIGNPLSGILGYLSLVRSKAPNGEVGDYLARIDTEVQRIDRIVRELLDLGRAPRGGAAAVDVGQIAAACTALLGAGPDFSHVQLSLHCEPGMLARAESGALSQVLLNLLINAAQAVEPRGAVEIIGRTEGNRVLLEVRDSGKGIPAEAMGRLFEPFFTTKANGRGTGLGLAISKHLVSEMGGELRAANAPEGGAVFSIWLPSA